MARNSLDNLFFKTAVHQCSDLVIITDVNAKIVYVNPAFENHTGYKLQQIKNKNISIVKSGQHEISFYRKLWSDIKKGKSISRVFINKKKNGELYYENKTITPIKNEKGKIEYYLSTSKDITKDRKLQKEILSQKTFTETVIQNTDALVVGLDADAKIVLFNNACEKLTGYAKSEAIGKNIFNLLIPRTSRKLIKNSLNQVYSKNNKYKNFENIWVTKDKKEILIKWSNSIINGQENEGSMVLSTGINITKERESEINLKNLNEELDEKVKQRTLEIEKLTKDIIQNNRVLNKVNHQLPAIIYLLNVKTKTIQFVSVNLNQNLKLPLETNVTYEFEKFTKHLKPSINKLISIKSFCNEKNNSEYTLEVNNESLQVQNKLVVFDYDTKTKPITYLGFLTDISESKKIQKRLEDSQKLAHIGTWEWDITTNDLYWSDEIYRIFEIDSNKFQPCYPKFLETIHHADRKLVEDAVNLSLENKTIYEVIHRLEPKPGRIKFVIEKGHAEYDLKGAPIRMKGTVRDITESEYLRKRMEETQDLAMIGTWEGNLITGERYWSKQMYEIFEYKEGEIELTHKNLQELIHPDDKDYVMKIPFESIEKKESYTIEYRIITKNKKIKYVCGRGYGEYDSMGNLVRILGAMQDITEEKILKLKLLNASTTLENSSSAIFSSDLNGKIEYANSAAVEMWGYDNLKQMLNERPMAFDYWLKDEDDAILFGYEELKRTGSYQTVQPLRAVKQNGNISLITYKSVLIKDEHGKPIAATASFTDVTEKYLIEKQLKEQNEKIDLLLDNIDEIVFGIDVRKGNIIKGGLFFMSKKSEKIIGISEEDIKLNDNLWYNSIHPDDVNYVIKTTLEMVETKQSITRTYRFKHFKTGEYIWLEDKVTPRFDKNDKFVAYYGSARDVTERINFDKKLIESEEKYRLISENNHDLISLRDKYAQPIYISNSVTSLLGYTVDEYLKLNLFDLIHPEDVEKTKKSTFDPTFKTQEKGLGEGRIKHKNGHYIWLQTLTKPVYDENGNVIQIVGSSRDITERKKLELAIQASERKYKSIYENALVGIFRTNIQTGKIIDANDVYIKLLGYDSIFDITHEFIVNDSFADLFEREVLLKKLQSNSFIVNEEVLFRKKNGATFWGNISLKIIPNEDILEGVVIDITESKNYKNELQKSIIEKDILLKEIHHRVKNNLQIISSLLKLQLNKIDNPLLKGPLFESRERIRAIALIHEKLYLSDDISTINFSDYIINLTRPMSVLNREKNINVVYALEDYYVNIDVAMPLGLACYEIISNSFKHAFNDRDAGKMKLSLIKTQSCIELIIKDNGCGFDINSIDLKKSLGWNLISSLIKQAKATLSIQSAPESGSEFKISFCNE